MQKDGFIHFPQKQLASEQGVSTTRVNDFISGRSEPNLRMAGAIYKLLKIHPAAMLMLCISFWINLFLVGANCFLP